MRGKCEFEQKPLSMQRALRGQRHEGGSRASGHGGLGFRVYECGCRGEMTGKVSRTRVKEFGLELEYKIQMPPGASINERNRLLFAF